MVVVDGKDARQFEWGGSIKMRDAKRDADRHAEETERLLATLDNLNS